MSYALSPKELRKKSDEALAYAVERKQPVIIQRDGSPEAVILDYEGYRQLCRSKETNLRRIQEIADEASARVAHLSDSELDNLILSSVRDVRYERYHAGECPEPEE